MMPLQVLLVVGDLAVSDRIRTVLGRVRPVRIVEIDTTEDLALFLRFGRFDLLLCDDRVSRCTSVEALRIWKAAGAPVPFVLVGNDQERDLAVACVTPGSAGYLVRGYADLPAACADVLAARLAVSAAGRQGGDEEQRLRDVLDETHRLTDQFVSAFSHELRTPLNTILGHADLLSDAIGPLFGDDAKRSLDAIIRSGMRLTNLINDTLDLARLRIGALEPEMRRFDAGRLVTEVVESFMPAAVAKGLTVATSVPPIVAPITTDAHRLRQILGYLIDNAIKFTPNGEIRVEVQSADDRLVIDVRDTGIGINTRDLPHVFDDFRQIDGGSTRSYDGCGLGLAVGRRLATMMGGSVEVESEPGRGSCFRISLPRRVSGRSNDQT